jgi:hypothetical protein
LPLAPRAALDYGRGMDQLVTNFVDVEFADVAVLKQAFRDGLVGRHTIVERTAKRVTIEFEDAAAAVHAKRHLAGPAPDAAPAKRKRAPAKPKPAVDQDA